LNWYEIFRSFQMKRNEINNLDPNDICSHAAQKIKKKDHDRQYLKKHNFISCILESHTHTHNCLCISGFFHRPAGSITNFHIAIHGAITALEEHINYESKKQKEEAPSNSSFNSQGLASGGEVLGRRVLVVAVHNSTN